MRVTIGIADASSTHVVRSLHSHAATTLRQEQAHKSAAVSAAETQCSSSPAVPSTSLALGTTDPPPALTPQCLSAPAGKDLTLTFSDTMSDAAGNTMPLQLVVLPAGSQAANTAPNAQGLGTFTTAQAVFVAPAAVSAGQATYDLGSLASGTHVITAMPLVVQLHAILTVS